MLLYVLAPIVFTVGVLSLFVFPAYFVFGIYFLFYLNVPEVVAINYGFIYLTEWLTLAIGAIVLRDLWIGRNLPSMLIPCAIIFVLYVGSHLLGLYVAKNPYILLFGTEIVLRNAMVALALVAVVRSRARFVAAALGIVLAATTLSLISLAERFAGIDFSGLLGFELSRHAQIAGDVIDARYQGTLGDPNYYAQVLVVAIPFLIPFFAASGSLAVRLLIMANLFSLFSTAILLTASRGALFAVVLTGFFAARRRPAFLILFTIGLTFFGLVLYATLPEALTDRIFVAVGDAYRIVRSTGYVEDEAVAGRVSEMAVGVIHFLEHPVMGIGYNQYEIHYQDTARLNGFMSRGADREAHSLYIEILAERGIVGAISFALLVTFAVLSVTYARNLASAAGDRLIVNLSSAMILSIVAFLASATFLHEAFPRYFWTLMALACASPQAMKSYKSELLRNPVKARTA